MNEKIYRCSAWVLIVAMATALVACGGGSPGSSTPTPEPDVTPPETTAVSVQLSPSSTEMPSSGTTQIDLTAVVLGPNSQVLKGRTVTFSTSGDPSAYINGVSASGVSDADGIVTAKLNLGTNKTLRTITVTATVDGVNSAAAVNVTDTAPAVTVDLLASSLEIPSAGTKQIDLTAVVLGPTRQTLAGRTVEFSASTDSSAYISGTSASGVSDANGLVTAKLNLGSNKTNRTIVVKATVDSGVASDSVEVEVTGTAITVSGSTSLSFGASTALTFVVKDSAGTPLPGAQVTLASKNGNTVDPSQSTTNSAGQITATVTATKSGDDVITASAAGASKTQALVVAGDSFGFSSPAADTTIPLNTDKTVSVSWTSNGAATVGKSVTFSATRGTVAATSASTNSQGVATITISSASAGPAIISASGPGGTPAAVLNVVFVATSADNINVQASPGVVQATSGAASQTSNSSIISAVVRDAVGNLVQSARVNFNITKDPSGGHLSAASATTDATGSASVTYVAGTATSPQNGVEISATVVDISGTAIPSPVSSSATLTVGGSALFVRLGTDNTVGKDDANPGAYTKTYLALVTDAAGNPVPAGTQVRIVLRPSRFYKGYYTYDTTEKKWVQTVTAICANEDLNFNGIIDAGEDTNTNGRLDPGNVAGVNGSALTDDNGFAAPILKYAKEYANWTEVTLEGRAGVVGDDPPSTAKFTLPGIADDYATPNPPPGVVSPFGSDSVCTDDL